MKILILVSLFSFLTLTSQAQTECRPLNFHGDQILCLSHGLGPFSVEERIGGIKNRLDQLVKDPTFDPSKLSVTDTDLSSMITAGDVIICSLSDRDVVKGSEIKSRQALAQDAMMKMRKAIREERISRSPEEIWKGVAFSLAATFGLILLLVGLKRLSLKANDLIARNEGKLIKSIKLNNYEILNSRRIVGLLAWIIKVTKGILIIFAFYIYVPLVLSFFSFTANLTPKLYGYIFEPLSHIFQGIVSYVPNLFFVLAITLVTVYSLKVIRFFFDEIQYGTLQIEGFYKEWAEPTYKLVRFLIIAFALVMAFPYLPGSSSPAFQGVSVFLGILLSLGSSSAVANIVAGVVLTYMRPFKKGDRVKISDTTGDVIEKNLLVTRIMSIKNVEISIPNSMVLGSHIVNFSTTAENEGLILNTTITIGYDVPWRQVHELLLEAAKITEGIESPEKAFVLQTALNDFYVSYELNAYTCEPNRMAVIYSRLHQNIQDAFNAADVEIMSPHYSALRDGNDITIPGTEKKAIFKFKMES